jgi:hypothetical protein
MAPARWSDFRFKPDGRPEQQTPLGLLARAVCADSTLVDATRPPAAGEQVEAVSVRPASAEGRREAGAVTLATLQTGSPAVEPLAGSGGVLSGPAPPAAAAGLSASAPAGAAGADATGSLEVPVGAAGFGSGGSAGRRSETGRRAFSSCRRIL